MSVFYRFSCKYLQRICAFISKFDLVISILYIKHTNEASKQRKQCLISMHYEIEHTNDYIELLMDAEILCEY